MRTEFVVVICRDASGMPAAPAYRIEVTDEQYDLGYHYDAAIEAAEEDGYEATMLSHCFDNSEHDQIINCAHYLSELKEMGLVDWVYMAPAIMHPSHTVQLAPFLFQISSWQLGYKSIYCMQVNQQCEN